MSSRGFLEWLLRLYPRGLRDTYGDEMRDVIRKQYARRLEEGRASTTYVVAAAAGLLGNALLAWLDVSAGRPASAARGLSLDGRFVRRSMGRSPGFALASVLVVGVSVALTTAAAGFLRGTLLPAPAYPDAERLVFAWGSNASKGQLRDVVSGSVFLDLRRSMTTLESLAAIHGGSTVVTKDGRGTILDTLDVTVDFLSVLGISPALGRSFQEENRTSSGPAATVVSHAFWRDHLGSDPASVGSSIVLDGIPHTVLGVLPRDFEFLTPAALVLPLHEDQLAKEDRTFYHYWLVGKLEAGETTGAASRELSAVLERIAGEDPRLAGWSVLVERVDDVSVAAVRPLLIAIGVAVALVLLAAAANLASLNLVRTLGRSHEIFVRRAMGAGRLLVARVLLLETAALVAVGTLAGLGGGVALLDVLSRTVDPAIPIPGSAATVHTLRGIVDVPVLFTGIASAVLTWGLLVLPSLLHLCSARDTTLRAGSGFRVAGPPAGARALVAAELALATVLLLGAGLLSRSADRLLAVDPGIDPENLLTLYVGQLKDPDPAARAKYFREVVRRVEELPDVTRAGTSDYVPFQGEDDFMGFRLEDRPPPPPGQGLREEWRRVSEGFFEAAGLSLRRGRGFEAADYEVTPAVVVVNEAFVRKYWSGADPVGRRLRIAREEYGILEVVGVVEDVPERGPATPPPPTFFVPLQGLPRDNAALFVRTAGEPLRSLDAVREAIWSVDSSQPIDRVFPMSALVDGTLALPRLARTFVAYFASVALGLAVVGLVGVVSHVLRVRRAELGVRLALGATPNRLRRDLLREHTPLAILGTLFGAALGVGAGYLARALLHGVSPGDPETVAMAAVAVVASALLATYLPTRSVARIDPAESVRDGL